MGEEKRSNYRLIITILGVCLVVNTYIFYLYLQGERSVILKSSRIPYIIDSWKGRDIPISERTYRILGTKDVVSREYINPSGFVVFLLIVFSDTNREAFHLPEICFGGGGASMMGKSIKKVSIKGKEIKVNKLYIENKSGDQMSGQMILYYFISGKHSTPNFYLQQIYFVINQVRYRKGMGALVRVSTDASSGEMDKALTQDQEFLQALLSIVPSIVGEK